MGKHNIEKKSFGYSLLYKFVCFWHNIVYYRSITIINKHNIPEEGRVIFTPNHQNALMDALALLFNIQRQLVFVARADIFKNKKIAAILYFLKILPIYRIRDGYDSLKNNKETFDKTADVLKEGNGLVILPEGNHAGSHRLRPLKKGFARIAFQTEEFHNFDLNIKIVPTGIDYGNYYKMRDKLLLNFGPPISISDYKALYSKNKPQALNKIREDLSRAISNVMIDIKSATFYSTYQNLREIYSTKYTLDLGYKNTKQPNLFLAEKKLIEKIEAFEAKDPSGFERLHKNTGKFISGIKKAKLSVDFFSKKSGNLLMLIVKTLGLALLLPIYLYSFILNLIPFQITMASPKIVKDPQFASSFKIIVSWLMFPLFYIMETAIITNVFNLPIEWYYFVASQIIAAIVAWPTHKFIIDTRNEYRFFLFKIKNKRAYKILTRMHQQIIGSLDELVTNF
jgi:1-acyl-sn-glycerol-3-phosphate acyltransferase